MHQTLQPGILSIVEMVSMTIAAQHPDMYCLSNLASCYSEDDYKNLYTPNVTGEEGEYQTAMHSADFLNNHTIQQIVPIEVAVWANEGMSLSSVTETAICVDGKMYVVINDDSDYDWL